MPRQIFKIALCIFFSFGIFFSSKGEVTLFSFDQNWLRYDKYFEGYLPIKNTNLKNSKSIHQSISFEKYKNYNLSFTATKNLALFINNKLIYKKVTNGLDTIRLSLQSIVPTLNSDEVIITFYHPEGELPFYTAGITNKVVQKKQLVEENKNIILFRNQNQKFSGYFILFLVIIALLILLKQLYPKEFFRHFSFRVQEKVDHLLPRTFSIPNLWMTFINGLTLSLLLNLLKINEIIFDADLTLLNSTLLITLFYFFFFLGKYIYILGIAWLFNYSKLVTSQFSEYIRLFEIVCILGTFILFGVEMSGFFKLGIKPIILYYSFIIVLILCVIKVIFLFFRLITHRNLYLFSYLCAAEILPLIIAVKFLLF